VIGTAYFGTSTRLMIGEDRRGDRKADDAKKFATRRQGPRRVVKNFLNDDGSNQGIRPDRLRAGVHDGPAPRGQKEAAERGIFKRAIERKNNHHCDRFHRHAAPPPALTRAPARRHGVPTVPDQDVPVVAVPGDAGRDDDVGALVTAGRPKKGFQDPGMNSFNH
jgi:hypothetical protein